MMVALAVATGCLLCILGFLKSSANASLAVPGSFEIQTARGSLLRTNFSPRRRFAKGAFEQARLCVEGIDESVYSSTTSIASHA
jgi:hypothetical protein